MKHFQTQLPSIKEVKRAVRDYPIGQSCHADSLSLVRSGVLSRFGEPGKAYQVVRGWSMPICSSQHSWVVIGDPLGVAGAIVIDVTRASYLRHEPQEVWVGRYGPKYAEYLPHGIALNDDGNKRVDLVDFGRIMPSKTEEVYPLSAEPRTDMARAILRLMDAHKFSRFDWGRVASRLPLTGWGKPGTHYETIADIFETMCEDPNLELLIPVDRLGHVTDLNPSELYW